MGQAYNTRGEGIAKPFFFEIAQGEVRGHSSVLKFGKAFDFTTGDNFVDIWDGCGNSSADLPTYTFSSTADIDSLSSSDNGDTMDIVVIGLDTNWAVVEQTITLTGQTRKALTTDLIRVYRMYVDGATAPTGNVFCFKNVATTSGVPNTAGNIRAMITATYNQSLMANYPIPAGKTGYLTSFYGTLLSKVSAECEVRLQVRSFGGVFRTKKAVGVAQAGSSFVRFDFEVPLKIDAKSDVKIISDTSIASTSMGAGFDIILVDN